MKDTLKRPKAQVLSLARYAVEPLGAHGWAVKAAGGASCTYGTQAEAIAAAKNMARVGGGEVRIQGRDGRWRDSFTLGREGFAKISAVEGLHISAAMKQDFRDLDNRGLSSEERRRDILHKYGKS